MKVLWYFQTMIAFKYQNHLQMDLPWVPEQTGKPNGKCGIEWMSLVYWKWLTHCKCLHPECNQRCKFWVQQILFAIFAIDIWNCCNYLLLQFYDANIHVCICRVCKLKLHIWLQKLAAIIDCNNCIQSATGHVTLVKVAVLATQTFTVQ